MSEPSEAASDASYRSPHGIEQDRRDFMRDNPELYVYIARREAHKALDAVGDLISGHHEAANLVWHRAGVARKGYEDMQQAKPSASPCPGCEGGWGFADNAHTRDNRCQYDTQPKASEVADAQPGSGAV